MKGCDHGYDLRRLFANTLDANDGVTNGDDTIFGYNGNDTIYGLGGDDVIWGGWAGFWGDFIDGGSGTDTAVYLDSSIGVTADLDAWRRHALAARSLTSYINIENLIGSLFGDVLVGDGGDNVLKGDFGDDELSGKAATTR